MKLCILDGSTTNPGDLSWEGLEAFGELAVYDFTNPQEILPRAAGCEIVITNKTPLPGDVIRELYADGLRYIGTLSTGYNVVDTNTAAELDIPVCNVPTYCTKAVAQFTFALIFAIANRVQEHNQSVHAGDWVKSRHFCYWNAEFIEMQGRTLGIVGFGNIGRTVAQIALILGMKVLVHTRTQRDLPEGCQWADRETLFRESDIVTLHCPLTSETEKLINDQTLSWMKPDALLINTSRGAVVDEDALARALNENQLRGAGLDVLSVEPPRPDNPLLTAKNCVITPHIAWAAKDARARLISIVTDNVRGYLEGNVKNNVAVPRD